MRTGGRFMHVCMHVYVVQMAAVERARRELQVSLKRRRNREVGQKTLVETPPRSSRFGWEWHLRDAAGKGLVTRVTRGNNTVIRLAQTQ